MFLTKGFLHNARAVHACTYSIEVKVGGRVVVLGVRWCQWLVP